MGSEAAEAPRQPLLHDLVTTFSAPVTLLSERSGQLRPRGAQGMFAADVRVLSRAEVVVDGREPEPVAVVDLTHDRVEFVAVLRALGGTGPDPTVWLRRRRTVTGTGAVEQVRIDNAGEAEVSAEIGVLLAADFAPIEAVKHGGSLAPRAAAATGLGMQWSVDSVAVTVDAPGAVVDLGDPAAPVARWPVVVPARGSVEVGWELTVLDAAAVIVAPASARPPAPVVLADDRRISALVDRALDDLAGLRAATPNRPGETFLTAGSPWYLTLFGRDSLWAARMLLPLGTELAAGTLRALAARQGRQVHLERAEEPGKILHEVRRDPTSHGWGRITLPPVYYGSVDATPLWVCLLADAWRWGMAADEVAQLLPAAERALEWLTGHGDPDGDGLLEYRDNSGRGLANQGWKDSGDSIRFADGRVAPGPVALAEVQGYAYEAALSGAALLDAFDRPGADRWRAYAAGLAQRFRDRFWVVDDLGPFPALALDGAKRAVDAPASNMGHLLGTGLLSPTESALVARRLVDPSLNSGFGLRTMAGTTAGYSPLSYHCGSVWPHDTAIAVHGLLRAGFPEAAATLAEGLLAAATAFDGRLPELYGGFAAGDVPAPVPYPAACRPQAWSAAAAVVVLQAFLGLEADVPGGTVTVRPSPALGGLSVDGLQVAGQRFFAGVRADGSVLAPDGLVDLPIRVVVGSPGDSRGPGPR